MLISVNRSRHQDKRHPSSTASPGGWTEGHPDWTTVGRAHASSGHLHLNLDHLPRVGEDDLQYAVNTWREGGGGKEGSSLQGWGDVRVQGEELERQGTPHTWNTPENNPAPSCTIRGALAPEGEFQRSPSMNSLALSFTALGGQQKVVRRSVLEKPRPRVLVPCGRGRHRKACPMCTLRNDFLLG